MDRAARVYVAGGADAGTTAATMLGRALVRRLEARGIQLVGIEDGPDLSDSGAVDRFFARARPEFVFLVAGKTAGIVGNQRFPADLTADNLAIAAHVIPAAWQHRVTKLLYLSSSCTYPKLAPQPLEVSTIGSGPLEPTSAAYAAAKLAGMALCDAYRRQHGARFVTAIGADAYGPGDDFSPTDSHVVGALIRRIHEAHLRQAASVEVWGSGTPKREFIYVDDLADACLFTVEHYEGGDPINLGTGTSTAIAELAGLIKDIVGFRGEIVFDRSKPDGMPFKGLDSTPLRRLGWTPTVELKAGLQRTYEWFRQNADQTTS
jgi:GDP-L-fucose synthase